MSTEASANHAHRYPHFSALVFLAHVDGSLDLEEEKILVALAERLRISEEDYTSMLANPMQHPIERVSNSDVRLRCIFDLFKLVFADYDFHDHERRFVYKYALQLGFSKTNVRKVVNRSVDLFSGNFNFQEYASFIRS